MLKERVLFICTHNSCRSQMAEGILRNLYGDRYEVYSAGTNPAVVNPYAIKVMSEIGIDISDHTSKGIQKFLDMEFEYVITVCDSAKETCPFFPNGKKLIHKGFKDPSEVIEPEDKKISVFRSVRDEIKEWIEFFFG